MWKLRQNDDVDVVVVVAFKTKLPLRVTKTIEEAMTIKENKYKNILNHHGNGIHFLFFDEPFSILISSILIFSDVDIFLTKQFSFCDAFWRQCENEKIKNWFIFVINWQKNSTIEFKSTN